MWAVSRRRRRAWVLRGQAGFTLVELVVSATVLALMATTVLGGLLYGMTEARLPPRAGFPVPGRRRRRRDSYPHTERRVHHLRRPCRAAHPGRVRSGRDPGRGRGRPAAAPAHRHPLRDPRVAPPSPPVPTRGQRHS